VETVHGGEEQTGGDLLVSVTGRGEFGDLALLRGEGGQAAIGLADGDADSS
jgi:hypothetical protein